MTFLVEREKFIQIFVPWISTQKVGVIFILRDFNMNLEKCLKVKVPLTQKVKIDLLFIIRWKVVFRIFICKSGDETAIERLFKNEKLMEDKINWYAFGRKLWFKGIRSALNEEIVVKTENHFDDLAITMVDNLVDKLLPDE